MTTIEFGDIEVDNQKLTTNWSLPKLLALVGKVKLTVSFASFSQKRIGRWLSIAELFARIYLLATNNNND